MYAVVWDRSKSALLLLRVGGKGSIAGIEAQLWMQEDIRLTDVQYPIVLWHCLKRFRVKLECIIVVEISETSEQILRNAHHHQRNSLPPRAFTLQYRGTGHLLDNAAGELPQASLDTRQGPSRDCPSMHVSLGRCLFPWPVLSAVA